MTLHRFQVFLCVANHLNVTRAARQLHISQPAVTQALKRLEKEFAVTLLRKKGRGIELTETGRDEFCRDAQTVLKMIEEMKIKYASGASGRCDKPQFVVAVRGVGLRSANPTAHPVVDTPNKTPVAAGKF